LLVLLEEVSDAFRSGHRSSAALLGLLLDPSLHFRKAGMMAEYG
jgi:hypothetical protein